MYQYPDYLMHYGIKGMKWGVRKQRVASGKMNRRSAKNSMSEADRKARRRRNMKIAAGVAGGALAAYGAHKIYTGRLNNRAAEKAEQLLKETAKMKAYEALAKENWTKYGRNFVYDMGDAIISGNKYGYGVVRK